MKIHFPYTKDHARCGRVMPDREVYDMGEMQAKFYAANPNDRCAKCCELLVKSGKLLTIPQPRTFH